MGFDRAAAAASPPAGGGGLQATVLLLDSCVSTVVAAVLYFAPHLVADFVFQRKTDGVHWHLVRCVGAQLLATAFVNIQLRNGRPMVRTVCYLLRILSMMVILMLTYQCRSQTPQLVHATVLECTRYIGFSVIAVYLVSLLYNGWPVGTNLLEENKIGNMLYQLDGIASITIGAAWLTFPKWLLHRQVLIPLDESHELCGRVMGAMFLSSYCISQHALHWPTTEDRKIVVDSRVVCCAAILWAQFWSQWEYHADWSGNHYVGISLFSIWTVLAFLYRVYLFFAARQGPAKNKAQ